MKKYTDVHQWIIDKKLISLETLQKYSVGELERIYPGKKFRPWREGDVIEREGNSVERYTIAGKLPVYYVPFWHKTSFYYHAQAYLEREGLYLEKEDIPKYFGYIAVNWNARAVYFSESDGRLFLRD